MKKIFKLRRTYLIIFSMLLIIGLTFFIVKLCTSEEEFDRVGVSFNSNQYEITSVSSPDDTSVVEMSELYTINSSSVSVKNNYASLIGTKTITISSAEELYAFSIIANSTSAFLSYNYKLLSNIDYSEFAYGFVPVGWNSENGFTGVFEGNGYTITGLKLMNIANPSEGTSPYAEMQYYAMFSKVGTNGVVSNFGLVNTAIKNTIGTSYTNIQGVAPAVGLNKGEVSYIFVIDTRDAEDAGIYAVGGYQIGGIMYQNEGRFHDSYSIYSRVVHYEVTDYIQFNELLNNNTGSVNNLYFYNSSISVYKSTADTEDVTYIDAIGKAYSGRTRFGIRVDSIKNLISSVSASSSKWYTSDNYNGEIDIETPITRGITYNSETKTFTVSNEAEFSYMFELMNDNSKFATKRYTYLIANNLNLSLLTENNYYYNSTLACTIKGVEVVNKLTTLADGNKSSYPTIFNPGLTKYTLTDGIECYGLFPYLSGEVSNLNVVLTEDKVINGNKASNVHAIGIVAGYVDGGTVKNVNVKYNNITLANNIGKYYFGSVVGVGASDAAVIDATASGTFSDGTQSSSITEATGFDNGVSIGGIIGYSTDTMISIYDALSCVNFNISSAGAFDTAVGGVLGSGYTINGEDKENDTTYNTSNLENRGTININSSSATNLYVAGIIGRHYGMANQVMSFNNAGNITVNGKGSNLTYIAGVENVTINSSSQLKSLGKRQYYASSLTNGAEIIANISDTTNVYFTNVLNIDSNASYKAKIYGVYNLGYNSYSNATLNSQEINMNYIQEFAPVVNYIDGTSDYYLAAEKVYNLRDITYTLGSSISTATTFNYTGCMHGDYVNYIDVRNEGNLTFNLNAQISTTSTLNVSGVFEELSADFTADKIFNDGNISITEAASNNVNLNMYISGICKANNSVITESEYNPLNKEFDNTTIGSLNNVINNGDIIVTSSLINENSYINASNSTYLNGDVYLSGIAYQNSGIISNTFNLGDVYLALYTSTAKTFAIGGIVYSNEGQYAQIRDCANNGRLQLVNLGSANTKTLVGGIACTNTSSNTNYNQLIAFTINYGEIFVINGRSIASLSSDPYTLAGGILASGICNIVNTVNYGNVHSSESAGGMIGLVDISDYNISTDNKVIIANTLNYGNIKAVNRYITVLGVPAYATYAEMKDITTDSQYIDYGFTAQPFYQTIGALVGVLNYDDQDVIKIRYLINFYENVSIICNEVNVPTNITTDVKLLANVSPNNKFLGQNVTYAPLSTISDEYGNIGVFSEEFMFRKAINGEISQTEITDAYIGDFFEFIAFEKINVSLLDSIGWRTIAYLDAAERFARDLNSLNVLFDSSHANINSNNELVTDALSNNSWLSNCDNTILDNLLDATLSTGDFDATKLKAVMNYLLFETEKSNVISKTIRQNFIESIISMIEENNQNVDYYALLNSLLYDELLAKVVAKDTIDYQEVLTKIRSVLSTSDNLEIIMDTYIEALESSDSLLDPLFGEEYSNYYLESKITLLNALLAGLNDIELQKLYDLLTEGISSNNQSAYLMYLGENESVSREIYTNIIAYNSFTDTTFSEALNDAFVKCNISNIISNEYDTNMLNRFETALGTIDDFTGSNITSLNVVPTKNYVELWNIIKNDSDFQAYLNDTNNNVLTNVVSVDGDNGLGIYAKATEYTNTYQSNDAPSTVGSNTGITRNESTTGTISTRFIYTPDEVVSTGTYFYGPYEDASYNIWWPTSTPGDYNRGFNLYTTGETASSNSTQRYVPFFCSLDKDFVQTKINGTLNSTVYEFYWNNSAPTNGGSQGGDSHSQWVSTHIIDKKPDDGHHYLLKNYTSGNYVYDYYDFSPTVTRTPNSEYTTTNITVPRNTVLSYVDTSGNAVNYTTTVERALTLSTDTNYASASAGHYYRNYYVVGYITASLISGIWYQQDIWGEAGTGELYGAFLTSKSSQKVDNYAGVHTTQYINYFLEDLINLDGVLSKGVGNNSVSTDEQNIINAVMTKVLSTENGKKAVLEAIASKSHDGFTSSQADIAQILLESAEDTTFASESVERLAYLSNEKLEEINYDTTLSLKSYLDRLISNVVYDLKEQITIKSLNNESGFKKVILNCYAYSKEAAKYYEYDIPVSGMNNFIYNYVNYLYEGNPDLTDSEITALLEAVSEQDLELLGDLYAYNAQLPSGYVYEDYTFDGEWIVNDLSMSVTYDNNSYNRYLYASSDSTIQFNSGTNKNITLIYQGTITINGETYTNNTLGSYEWELSSNTDYTILCSNGSQIYNIGYSVPTNIGQTPYLSNDIITVSTVATANNITAFQLISRQSNNLTLEIPSIENDDIDSVSIAFSYFRGSSNNRFTYVINGTTYTQTVGSGTSSNTEYQVDEIELDTFPQSIVFQSTQASDNRYVYIYKLRLIYRGTLSNGDSYVFTQYFNADGSNTNTIEITNTSGELHYQIGSGVVNSLTNTTTTLDSDINEAISFYSLGGYSILDTSGITGDYSASIQKNFNNYYSNLSEAGKYFTSMTLNNSTSLTSVTIVEPAYILVKASNANTTIADGSITLNGTTNTITDDELYYCYYIENNGTYNITSTNATITEVLILDANSSIVVNSSGSNDIIGYKDDGSTIEVFNADYSAIPNFNINSYITNALEGQTLYETYLTIYPYIRTDGISNSKQLREADLIELIMTLFPTIKQDNNNVNYWSVFNDSSFSEDDLKEIIKLTSAADYSGTSSALAKLAVSQGVDYNDVIKLISSITTEYMIESITYIKQLAISNNYSKILNYYISAYVGSDFIINIKSNTLQNSILYEILDDYSNGRYQFINSNTTIDSNIFIDLMTVLGFNLSTQGYGIYALSSSKGIGDGIFIPDNFSLKNMDTNYNDSLKLIDDVTSSWRGGIASDENNKAEGSVNEAFLVDMKQLKKSISTTIFTLNFSVGNYQIYSAESLIDVDNHIITYYVPSDVFNTSNGTNVTITKLIIANAAASNKVEGDTLSLKLGENSSAIRITAEDDTVFADYIIILEEMDVSFDITNTGTTTIASTGESININIISPSISENAKNKLPENFDLRPYLYLVNSNGQIVDQYDAEKDTYTYISFSYEDGYNLVKNDGSAVIGVEIDQALPTGNYKIYVSIFDTYGTGQNGKYISFTKSPSTDATMKDVSFDGKSVEFTQNGNTYTATSLIQFGRAYSYVELLEMNYLDYIPTFANGSTQEISVSKTEPGINEPMSYVVQYIITAENGNQNTYIHNLLEETPFIENGVGTNYVTWYIDGDSQGTRVYDTSNDADNDIKSSFERGEESIYRIKFEMSSFYTLGDVSYACDYTAKEGVAASTVGAGISVQISDAADTGEYEFTYIYSSEGIWSDGTYVREYTFPSLILSKNPSKDATLSRLTFLDSNVVASGLSTIINPNYALKPVENQAALTNVNELYYYDELYNSSGKEILVEGKTINYNNLGHDYATTDVNDTYFTNHFFSLGSIANAQLQYYAPVFDIEDHAQMYQYTTLNKLKYYGATKQQKSDTEVLTSIFEDGDITYLYIPFSTEDNKTAVFLVELDITNNTWTNVYTTAFDGTNADSEALGSLNGDKTTGISYQGSTYYVDESAGKPIDNVSLYMDYIGSPEQDHFWYISYIVLSEDYLKDSTPSDNLAYKCYHISLIDITNTVFYEISIKAPKDFALENLYLTIGYNVYDVVNNVEQSTFTTNSISAYASKDSESQFDGYDSYTLNSNLSILPNGYYYFYVDLPDGYAAKLTVDKVNRNDKDYQNGSYYKESEDGAYLPPSSIVTQKVAVQIEIYSTLESDGTIWGEATSNIYTKQIILE